MESFVTPELIHAIAHTVDIPELSPAAAKALAPDAEYKLRELIQDAHKFARHAQRVKLTTEDVNNALRMRNAEPLYGYSYKKPLKPKPGGADDKGKSKADEVERGVKYIKVVGQVNVYAVEDRELAVDQLVEEPLPRPPVEVGVMPHWLFIEGVQPLTPENTPLERPLLKKSRPGQAGAAGGAGKATAGTAAGAGQAGGGGAAGQEQGSAVQVQLPVQHVLPLELQLYFNKAMDIIASALTAAKTTGSLGSSASGTQDGPGTAGGTGSSGPQQHQHWGDFTTPAAATEQQQPAAPEANGDGPSGEGLQPQSQEAKLAAVLASLTTDAGLHPLTPYWVKFIADEVAASLPYVPALQLLLRLAKALLHNESLRLDEYVHQLLPALLTCVVAKGIGSSSLTAGSSDALAAGGHPLVRRAAAELVAEVCARFGSVHLNVQPRVSKTLLNALLDTSKPLTTHYGAVLGLSALGPTAVRLLLLPNLPAYLDRLTPLLTPPTEQPHPQTNGTTSHDMDISPGKGGGSEGGGAGSASVQAVQAVQAQRRYTEALRVHGALIDAVATSLYELMVDKAAGAVPDTPLCWTRPTASVLTKVAEAFQQQQQQQQSSKGGAAPSSIAASGPDSDRSRAAALLAVSWREDVSLSDVAWAAGELLGPALLARLPQARPAQACL